MQTHSILLENKYQIQIFESITKIDAFIWNTINTDIAFYQTHEFLSTIEILHPSIGFRYVLVYDNSELVAAIYVQLLNFSYKNLVNYGTEKNKGVKSSVKKYIAKKNTKLLNLGNVFFTGDNGIISKNEDTISMHIPTIFRHIHQSFQEQKPKAFLIANIYLQDEVKCANYCNGAFHPFITEPDMFMHIDNSWTSFDDYVQALASKYRIRAKKVLAVSNNITSKELSLTEIQTQAADFNKLYNNVVNHVAFNMATLNIQFFEEMKKLYCDNCCILGYYLEDELVSFACLFQVDVSTVHVHYIGLNYEINKSHKLYNRMLLDFVKFAIEKRKFRIHFGRTATEIKTTIGAKPNELRAYLKMQNPIFNRMLPYFLNRIKPQEYIVRNPFK
ncbi:MAG: peptidogalycan biosysnthesis protein [Chitinophagales bacterium]